MDSRSNSNNLQFWFLMAGVFVICVFDIAYVWISLEDDILASNLHWPQQLDTPIDLNTTVLPEQRHAYTILKNAGVTMTPEIISKLPLWPDIVSQYGNSTIIHNLESCAEFRATVPKQIRMAGVAGMFNTGTNLLGNLMVQNCEIKGRRAGSGMRQQVPWGKHNPPITHRLVNVAKVGGKGINQTAVFPAVLIKDPYHWIISQCRHKYMTQWEHDPEHCPNIVSWKSGKPVQVRVKYALEARFYETFVGMWNEWYREYESQAGVFPLAFLRFEDLLFHPEEVVNTLCECVGGERKSASFNYLEESAKNNPSHKGSNGLVNAILRYGDSQKRLEGWTKEDWEYARVHLDQHLMDKYGYSRPNWV